MAISQLENTLLKYMVSLLLVGSKVESRSFMSVNLVNTESIIRSATKQAAVNATRYSEGGKLRRDKEVKKAMLELQPKLLQMISKVKIGEIQNIIITAVGTGLIAPIFIKYNPLSKTDKDTKTYTAFRQPVSALIAVVTQAGIVDRFNKYIANKTNSGRIADDKFNKSCFQDESYLQGVVKKSYPNLSKEGVANKVMELQEQQLEKMMKSARSKNTIEYISNGKTVTLPEEQFRELINSTTNDMLKNINKGIDSHTTEALDKKITKGLYLRTNNEKIQEILNDINTNIEKLDDKGIKEYFKAKNKELKANKADKELIEMVNDIYGHSTKETITERISDKLKKVKDCVNCESEEALKTTIMNTAEAERKALLAEKANVVKLQTGIKKGISVAGLERFSKKFAPDLLYDTVMKHVKNIESNIDGYKQMTGLIVSLAILPVSCAILNYVYPKIMDALFPELSKTKHSKEKDKFIKGCDAANQTPSGEKVNDKTAKEVK